MPDQHRSSHDDVVVTSRNTQDRDQLAAQVTAARKKRKWTQADLATAAGVSTRSVVNLESGTKVSLKTVDLVSAALGWKSLYTPTRGDETTPAPDTDEFIQEAVRFLPTVLTYYGPQVYEEASAAVSEMLRKRRTDDE
ncbi:helix-turn-helix domain-containing protein [Saccharopolyspora tripterygii]